MVRPVEKQEAVARSILMERVKESRRSDPDARQQQFAQQLQDEASKRQEQVEKPAAQDQVLIGKEPEPERKQREKRRPVKEPDGEDEAAGEERPEGGIDLRA
jgi:hypothetical protein